MGSDFFFFSSHVSRAREDAQKAREKAEREAKAAAEKVSEREGGREGGREGRGSHSLGWWASQTSRSGRTWAGSRSAPRQARCHGNHATPETDLDYEKRGLQFSFDAASHSHPCQYPHSHPSLSLHECLCVPPPAFFALLLATLATNSQDSHMR